jgi:hypothetical protein
MSIGKPFGGIFGDSNLIRVVQQIVADPFTEYLAIDLEMLTSNYEDTRNSIAYLVSIGFLIEREDKICSVYKANTNSKKYIALQFLAYAVFDDKNETDTMNDIVEDYFLELLAKMPLMGDYKDGVINRFWRKVYR